MSERTFSRRAVIVLVTLMVASVGIGLVSPALTDAFDPTDQLGATTYSVSALGHSGFVRFLEALGHDPLVARTREERNDLEGAVLVLAEPTDELEDLLTRLDAAEDALIVLPKRRDGRAGADGRISSQFPVSDKTVDEVIEAMAVDGHVVRLSEKASTVQWGRTLGPHEPVVEELQLMRIFSDHVEELVSCDDGVLVARVELMSGGQGMILSDPDIIANHGLDESANALFLARLLREFGSEERVFVVDEGIHGFGAASSIYAALFRFPLVLVTMQALLVFLLALWFAARRFGTPLPPPPPIPPGKGTLIDNTARLLEFGGHRKMLLQRYLEESIDSVARRLRAPSSLAGAELHEWLERLREGRGIETGLPSLQESVRRGTAVRTTARRIHTWRTEMLDGSRDHQRSQS